MDPLKKSEEKMPDVPTPVLGRRPDSARPPSPSASGAVPPEEAPSWKLPYRIGSQVKALPTEFLWEPYIPKGAITMLAGKGGMGKSTIVCSIASALSAGRMLHGARRALPPQKVLMISAEDDIERRLVPTLQLMQANMDNIALSDATFLLDGVHTKGIHHAMASFQATVVFLDPVVSYLGGDMDMNQSNQVRELMDNLDAVAKRNDRAIIVVHHTRKDAGPNPGVQDAMGSGDFGNKSRSALIVWMDKQGQRYIKHAKHNWSKQGDTIEYGLETVLHENGTEYSNVVWGFGFQESEGEGVPKPTQERVTDKAREWLFDQLKDGPKLMKELQTKAETDGVSMRAIDRVKVGMASSRKTRDGWVWELVERAGMGDPVLPLEPTPLPVPQPQERPSLDPLLLQEALSRMKLPHG